MNGQPSDVISALLSGGRLVVVGCYVGMAHIEQIYTVSLPYVLGSVANTFQRFLFSQ